MGIHHSDLTQVLLQTWQRIYKQDVVIIGVLCGIAYTVNVSVFEYRKNKPSGICPDSYIFPATWLDFQIGKLSGRVWRRQTDLFNQKRNCRKTDEIKWLQQ